MIACKDCKYCELRPSPMCFHPQSRVEIPNYFLGTASNTVQSAQSMRAVGACGPDATLFEPIGTVEATEGS
jgi:hypothetical protein